MSNLPAWKEEGKEPPLCWVIRAAGEAGAAGTPCSQRGQARSCAQVLFTHFEFQRRGGQAICESQAGGGSGVPGGAVPSCCSRSRSARAWGWQWGSRAPVQRCFLPASGGESFKGSLAAPLARADLGLGEEELAPQKAGPWRSLGSHRDGSKEHRGDRLSLQGQETCCQHRSCTSRRSILLPPPAPAWP